MLTIELFYQVLMLPGQLFVHPTWLEQDELGQMVLHLEELGSHAIDLLYDGVGDLLGFFGGVLMMLP